MGEREDHTTAIADGVRDVIAQNTADAPTEPGVYRLLCGACHVDFFVGPSGTEHWLVAGDAKAYTRESVAVDRHGDHPWTRLYSLQEAALQIQHLAALKHESAEAVVARLLGE